MKSWVLSRTELLFLPEIALFIFLAVFIGAIFWMFRPGSRQFYQRCRFMALDENEMEVSDGQSL